MTRIIKAKVTLAVLCVLFFMLGTGSTIAMAPLVSLDRWFARPDTRPDYNWDVILGLNAAQVRKQDALYRERDAAIKQLETEIKRLYYPKIQAANKRLLDRLLNEVYSPEQRLLFEEYSTGKRELPNRGEKS